MKELLLNGTHLTAGRQARVVEHLKGRFCAVETLTPDENRVAGIQCVLASDDPLFFGNDGLSYDFWEALIAWNLDLAALKKLARNSITYAGMDEVSKANLMKHWEREWDKFINKFAQIEH